MFNLTEQEIMERWDIRSKPVVSICSATYNHENFISEAIDSFLMQKTDFPFEILIRDDCSTDKTVEIIRDYAKRYPNIIKPIFEVENQYVKGQRPMPALFEKAVGKYIAMCEGDDYWGDTLKLQKQVDFLETHNSYSVSYHDAVIIDSKGEIISNSYNMGIRDFSVDELLSGDAFILTGTAMLRNVGSSLYPEIFDKVANGDMTIWHILGSYGAGKFQSNVSNSYYRIHSGGVWSNIGDKMRIMKTIQTLKLLKKNLPDDKKYLEDKITQRIHKYHVEILHILLRKISLLKYSWHIFSIIFDKEVDTASVLKLHYNKGVHFFLLKMKIFKNS